MTLFQQPPEQTYLLPMSHEEAITILSDLERGIITSCDPDTKRALRMAKIALISEKLNLGQDAP